MTRTWHLKQAYAARRMVQRYKLNPDMKAYWFHRGQETAHLDTCTAIDRSTKRAQKTAARAKRAA